MGYQKFIDDSIPQLNSNIRPINPQLELKDLFVLETSNISPKMEDIFPKNRNFQCTDH